MLLQLGDAARVGARLDLDGHDLDLSGVPAGLDVDLTSWLGRVELVEGIRALATAGRWDKVFEHLRARRDVGGRGLHDARQAAVLALHQTARHRRAERLLDDAVTDAPWEHLIAACLTAHVRGVDAESAARLSACVADTTGTELPCYFRVRQLHATGHHHAIVVARHLPVGPVDG